MGPVGLVVVGGRVRDGGLRDGRSDRLDGFRDGDDLDGLEGEVRIGEGGFDSIVASASRAPATASGPSLDELDGVGRDGNIGVFGFGEGFHLEDRLDQVRVSDDSLGLGGIIGLGGDQRRLIGLGLVGGCRLPGARRRHGRDRRSRPRRRPPEPARPRSRRVTWSRRRPRRWA